MCGRYVGFDDGNDVIKDIYKQVFDLYPDAPIKIGEVFPTETVPVLTGPSLSPVPMQWGYPTYTGKGVLINARAESVMEKNTFRNGFLYTRCVIPTCGYYEWDKQKTKFRFLLPNDPTLYLGGFFSRFADGYRFIILTTQPNESVQDVHNRMPLILSADRLSDWTGNTPYAMQHLKQTMPALIRAQA